MKRTAISLAVLITLGLALAACSSGGKSSTPDRGISACQHYAGPQQGSDGPALVKDLQASSFADLKAAGDGESKALASGDSGQQLSAGFTVAAACSAHGIDIRQVVTVTTGR